MFTGLSPLSPSSVGMDLTSNKMWVVILLITLSCLSTLNQLLCILFLCKYHFMQEGIFVFLICSYILKCNMNKMEFQRSPAGMLPILYGYWGWQQYNVQISGFREEA